MPRLNVNRVLLNPKFCDSSLVCERRTSSVDTNGRGVTVEETKGFAGVVTSDKGQRLQREAVGERAVDTITVITQFKLRDAGTGYTADVVRWNGSRYTVMNVNDYSRYGPGFVECSCEMIPLAGTT